MGNGHDPRAMDFGLPNRQIVLSDGFWIALPTKRAEERPCFIAAATQGVGGWLIPVPGGVLIRGDDKEIIGAIGITGDKSDNDEATALAGLATANLAADPS
jgi:uncharacterized protein GlcG (DUF336 family)